MIVVKIGRFCLSYFAKAKLQTEIVIYLTLFILLKLYYIYGCLHYTEGKKPHKMRYYQ